MKTITLMNEKGGVGKTTLSTYLAVGLAMRGQRVLFIDSDMQGNSTSAFGMTKAPGLYNLIVRGQAWNEALVQVPPDNIGGEGLLFLLPSNFETRFLAEFDGLMLTFAKRMREISKSFDVCIIDTSPQATKVQEAIVMSSEYLLMPTDCESFAILEGLVDSIEHTRNLREQAVSIGWDVANLLGIIPNKFRETTALHVKFYESLKEEHGDIIFEPIPLRVAIAESQFMQEFLFTAAPHLDITKRLDAMVERVMAVLEVKHDKQK
jgi:chromosome partitioning protein